MKSLRVLGLCAVLFTLLLPLRLQAQPTASSATRLANLEATVAALGQAVTSLQADKTAQANAIVALQAALAAAQAMLTQQSTSLATLQTALAKEVADRKTYADSAAATALASAKTYADGKVAPVADKLTHFSRSGNEVYITGANLNIRNGSGYTYQVLNGLGNLVLGYNELRSGTGAVNTRTGSHNLILGFNQNFSRAGALMLGAVNNSSGHFASVLGGTGNTASGLYAAVVGGYDNQISDKGDWSTVLGGRGVRVTTQVAHVP